jgi:hypothetical protein
MTALATHSASGRKRDRREAAAPGAERREAPHHSKRCATMRNVLDEPLQITAKPSPTRRRRARLWRAADRFEVAIAWDAVRVRHFDILTFTTASADLDVCQGRMRRVTARLRKRWPGIRYFAWFELQARGAGHYQMIVPNAPWRRGKAAMAWLTNVWGAGHVWATRHSEREWAGQGAGYARSYAKKMGNKAYQQDYDGVPLSIRTFMTHRLGHAVMALDMHRDRWEARYSAGVVTLTARLEHVRGSPCRPAPGELARAEAARRCRAGRVMARRWVNAPPGEPHHRERPTARRVSEARVRAQAAVAAAALPGGAPWPPPLPTTVWEALP